MAGSIALGFGGKALVCGHDLGAADGKPGSWPDFIFVISNSLFSKKGLLPQNRRSFHGG